MPYIGIKPGQKVTVTIDGYLDEVLHHGVKVSFGGGYQVEIFTETDDVSIAFDDTPEHWPPQAGDIWRLFEPDQDESDIEHGSVWLASRYRGEDTPYLIESHNINSGWKRADDLREIGRMELAYRAGVKP